MSNCSQKSPWHQRIREKFERSLAQTGILTERYQYQPLPSQDYFRTLELLPGNGTDIIRCRLYTKLFADAVDKYAAISYVWGRPKNKVQIICDDRIIKVTVNLADALYQIRNRNESIMVWADAICINQQDNIEKGHQVKRMGDVFQNAKEVLAWLGKDVEQIAEDSFNLIRETNEYMDTQWTTHGQISAIPTITRAFPPFRNKLRWTKVRTLLELDWFDRVWVLQEAGLAKHCQLFWGTHKIDLAEICELSEWFKVRADVSSVVGKIPIGRTSDNFDVYCRYDNVKSWRDSKPLIRRADKLKKSREGLFLAILVKGRLMEASFDVDRVYAFLGSHLARKGTSPATLVEPDYNRSVSEVYFELARALLSHQREAPYLLSFVDHDSPNCVEGITVAGDYAFPSWVPRWDTRGKLFLLAYGNYWYQAGMLNRPFRATVQSDKSLLLPALFFDKIVWTSHVLQQMNFRLNPELWNESARNLNTSYIDDLFAKVQQALKKHCSHPSSESLSVDPGYISTAFSLTMVRHYAGLEPEYHDLVQHQQNFTAYLHAARNLVETQTHTVGNSVSQDLAGNSHDIENSIQHVANRRFAITECGRFGLVPGITQWNDICSISPGMKVPLILRPREDGRYGLVGDSYIHGVMAGEIMEKFDKGEIELTDLVLV
jgi:hypothetical protein